MDLNFSKEDLEFRDEVRAFLENEYPKHIREKMHNGDELTRDEVVEWHKCIAKKGWMGHSWPVEHGGTGWDDMQRYIFSSECASAGAPSPTAMGLHMVGPVLRHRIIPNFNAEADGINRDDILTKLLEINS